jgi:hypothetical protein
MGLAKFLIRDHDRDDVVYPEVTGGLRADCRVDLRSCLVRA